LTVRDSQFAANASNRDLPTANCEPASYNPRPNA
jgi:hypothetical protein